MLAVLKLSVEREQVYSQCLLPASPADTLAALCVRGKRKQGPCSGPVRMAEEILLPKGVCWRPRLGASFLGVTHPHAPPREHWSYAHCILGRPRPAASGRLHTVTISASFPLSHIFCWKADLGHVPGSGGRGGWQR